MGQKKWLLILAGIAGIGVTSMILILIAIFAGPGEPPLPESADLETAAKFMESDDFLKLSTKKRSEYIDKMTQRYEQLSEAERREASRSFHVKRHENHDMNNAFLLSFGLNHAVKCNEMPEKERKQYVDNMIVAAERLGMAKELQEVYEYNFSPYASNKQKLRSVKDYQKAMPFLMQNTTAKERSKLLKTTELVVDRLEKRYGKRQRRK